MVSNSAFIGGWIETAKLTYHCPLRSFHLDTFPVIVSELVAYEAVPFQSPVVSLFDFSS